MTLYTAADSNALTYLVIAILVEGYNPVHDCSGLADQRVAMARLFMYGDCQMWVPPVVRAETGAIPDERLRDLHNRLTWFQLLDHESGVNESTLQARTIQLQQHHSGVNDCRVIAEAEGMQVSHLVTMDDKLQRRLQVHTKIQIVRPLDLWNSLGINCAPPHSMVPAPSNPLSARRWWRLPDCPSSV